MPLTARHSQRGAAALAVSMLLLFGITLVAFFMNRAVIFEQRTSANQVRSTRAFEMAEAGLEWATARLNDDIAVAASPSCVAGTGAGTFRERYLTVTGGANPAFTINTAARTGCSIAANGTATCSCPSASLSPVLGAATDPRFTVQFNPVTTPVADTLAVEIIAYGCTSEDPWCNPGSTATADATAVVRTLLKVRPRFPTAPGAGLITGGSAVPGGNMKVVNLDIESNGITINAGTSVDLTGSTSVVTLAGTPPSASVLDNDPSLQALTTADADGNLFFTGFFGESITDYQNNPQTWLITAGSCGTRTRCTQCTSATACGTAVSAAYDNRVTQFWSDTNVQFGSANLPAAGTLGTVERPLTLASSATVELRAAITAYGMFYAATASATENWDFSGSGSAKVFGAFVSRGDFVKGSGTLDLIYDPDIFGRGQATGLLVRVPGSWRDKLTDY